jgi:Tfp pilus assembly protein PilV
MRIHLEQGIAYVEVLVAALLLALCVMPAASAVKNALAAPDLAQAKMRELRCMQAAMETVLAQPYIDLWNGARGTQQATAYSQPADANCMQRDVYITKYQALNGKAPVFLPYPDTDTEQHLEDVLLYVTVSSPDSPYTFTTLVAR